MAGALLHAPTIAIVGKVRLEQLWLAVPALPPEGVVERTAGGHARRPDSGGHVAVRHDEPLGVDRASTPTVATTMTTR